MHNLNLGCCLSTFKKIVAKCTFVDKLECILEKSLLEHDKLFLVIVFVSGHEPVALSAHDSGDKSQSQGSLGGLPEHLSQGEVTGEYGPEKQLAGWV